MSLIWKALFSIENEALTNEQKQANVVKFLSEMKSEAEIVEKNRLKSRVNDLINKSLNEL